MTMNLTVGKRLGLGFAAVLVLLVIVAGVGIVRLKASGTATTVLIEDRYAKLKVIGNMRQNVALQSSRVRDLVIVTDPARVKEIQAAIGTLTSQITEDMAYLERELNTEKGRALYKTLNDARTRYLDTRKQIEGLMADGKREEALKQVADALPGAYAGYAEALDKLSSLGQTLMEKEGKAAQEQAENAVVVVGVLASVAVVLAVLLSLGVTRSIVVPLRKAVGIADQVAAGDLTANIDTARKDEIGHLLEALKRMNGELVRMVGNVRISTETIHTASSEIATGNHDLSQRTEEQASSLEETAASMEELTSTVKQNADNARQANQLAASASQVAAKGGSVVSEVVTTMGAINESSRKIADIIGVIDGIAFQTNILALNAAVEAARAGEQGRGFAVVASEVRNLAQRSAAAAKEIKTLIEDSVGKVETGTKLVDEAGSTMSEVVHSIKRVTDIVAEITAASEEQSSGIAQVNDAITQMDRVTQQNAALVEEAAAAAESMQAQAQQLTAAVAAFKVTPQDNVVAAPPAAVAVAPKAGAPLPVRVKPEARPKAAPRVERRTTSKPKAKAKTWPEVERRGPHRAKNVSRLQGKLRAAGGSKAPPPADGPGDWTEF